MTAQIATALGPVLDEPGALQQPGTVHVSDGSNPDHLVRGRMSGFASCGHARRVGLGRYVPKGDICSAANRSLAVGTRVTSRPPHRSVRAAFPHTAPTSGMEGNNVACW